MKRIAFRVVPAMALLVAVYAWVAPARVRTGQRHAEHQERRVADVHRGPYAAASTRRSTRLTRATSARWKSRGASRPTTSVRAPKPSSAPRRSWSTARVYAAAGTRRAVVALDAKTGEQKWMYSMDEGERATRWAPRQLSGRGVAYWTDGKTDDRIYYVTTGYRLVALNAKTGEPIPTFGEKGVSRPQAGRDDLQGRQAGAGRSREG